MSACQEQLDQPPVAVVPLVVLVVAGAHVDVVAVQPPRPKGQPWDVFDQAAVEHVLPDRIGDDVGVIQVELVTEPVGVY